MSFLYDQTGKRKYLTINERRKFLDVAKTSTPEIRTFCTTLAFTGARISEILALTPDRIDCLDNLIIIECLKKRSRGVYRIIPVPRGLVEQLEKVHEIKAAQRNLLTANKPIWPWCRTTGWKHVKQTMKKTGLVGAHACPKGLRHAFGVTGLQKQVPINMVRKWLGHSKLSTTAIQACFARFEAKTKYNIAKKISQLLPEFLPQLPPPRKIWLPEDYRMSIFDAASLIFAHFYFKEEDPRKK